MAYRFSFDLTKLPFAFFEETEEYSNIVQIQKNLTTIAKNLVKKYQIDKLTGLPIYDSITLLEDFIQINIQNKILKNQFIKSKKRAIFLPHCCRKYMDSRCKAIFNSKTSTYTCQHCSKDCMVNKASQLAKKENYDVYILPGASCTSKIFQQTKYDGIIGVACTDELKLATKGLLKLRIPGQGIPLIKNGCSQTTFKLKTLEKLICATKTCQ
jgi:hypothetical protein